MGVLALLRKGKPSSTITLEELPDEELMMRYASGEVAAFEELVRRHEKAVFNFIARFLGDRTAAEDLVQEVFFRVIRTASRYKKKAKFRTWLFTIARNACIDRARSQSRKQEMSLNRTMNDDGDGQGVTFMDQLPDATSSDGAGQTLRAEFRTRLQSALDELPEDQREVFVMREFGGLRFREIAMATNVSENTVKSRMRYALEALRGHLADYREHSFDREEDAEKPAAKSGII